MPTTQEEKPAKSRQRNRKTDQRKAKGEKKAEAGPQADDPVSAVMAPIEAAQVEIAPVEIAPIEITPVEITPVEIAEVEVAAVEAAPAAILDGARRSLRGITAQREATARRVAARLGIVVPVAATA